ncbi:hypothetical protein CVT26_014916 [Gymnopilus dilepis]|uniref:Glycoside hydrolase family 5 domain-containing protein n=1 Tax=Gymnopilus dilepis TaxID=231916 RepID=A0A409XWW7_9AGAR|nr:hypothetical protein CVT26_014916 [Gymnopilus dilepis]
MRRGPFKGLLPLGLALLCFETILLFSGSPVAAKRQQCRLEPHGKQVALQAPTNTGVGGDVPNATSTATATNQQSTPAAVKATGTASSAASPTPTPFNYETQKIRGVNIGGWLVLEASSPTNLPTADLNLTSTSVQPWITPSVFESTGNTNIVDEFTLGQLLDPQTAQNILTNHWETWITEDDFAQIAAAGLNHVRIPIGYWSIPLNSSSTSQSTSTAPYTTGAWPYLLKALSWAQKYNINVILDLHGAPGSQNGYDNSGQRTSNPVWALNPSNVSRTIDTLKFLAEEVGDQISVLELLNEGAGFLGSNWASTIRQFFGTAYGTVRSAVGNDLNIMIGDAFLGVDSWTNFLTGPSGTGVLMDFHEYQIFSDPELDRTDDEHISFACTYMQSLGSFAASNIWTVVGEWSTAVTDCAQWLNGRNVGARWDGTYPGSQAHGSCQGFTGSSSNFSQDYKTFLRKYWEVQVEVGENVNGWVYWTWKAENADEWSYQKGLQGGWIPQDPTNRLYPGICS